MSVNCYNGKWIILINREGYNITYEKYANKNQ